MALARERSWRRSATTRFLPPASGHISRIQPSVSPRHDLESVGFQTVQASANAIGRPKNQHCASRFALARTISPFDRQFESETHGTVFTFALKAGMEWRLLTVPPERTRVGFL